MPSIDLRVIPGKLSRDFMQRVRNVRFMIFFHFYDLYCLITSPKGKSFVSSNKFKPLLDELWEHDKTLFDEPTGWQEFSYKDSPLVKDFDKIWSKIAKVYKVEISALAFTEIPSAENVSEVFKNIFHSLN